MNKEEEVFWQKVMLSLAMTNVNEKRRTYYDSANKSLDYILDHLCTGDFKPYAWAAVETFIYYAWQEHGIRHGAHGPQVLVNLDYVNRELISLCRACGHTTTLFSGDVPHSAYQCTHCGSQEYRFVSFADANKNIELVVDKRFHYNAHRSPYVQKIIDRLKNINNDVDVTNNTNNSKKGIIPIMSKETTTNASLGFLAALTSSTSNTAEQVVEGAKIATAKRAFRTTSKKLQSLVPGMPTEGVPSELATIGMLTLVNGVARMNPEMLSGIPGLNAPNITKNCDRALKGIGHDTGEAIMDQALPLLKFLSDPVLGMFKDEDKD